MHVGRNKVQPSDIKVEFVSKVDAEWHDVEKSLVEDELAHEIGVNVDEHKDA